MKWVGMLLGGALVLTILEKVVQIFVLGIIATVIVALIRAPHQTLAVLLSLTLLSLIKACGTFSLVVLIMMLLIANYKSRI